MATENSSRKEKPCIAWRHGFLPRTLGERLALSLVEVVWLEPLDSESSRDRGRYIVRIKDSPLQSTYGGDYGLERSSAAAMELLESLARGIDENPSVSPNLRCLEGVDQSQSLRCNQWIASKVVANRETGPLERTEHYALSLELAIEYHCRGQQVPEEVAFYCPSHAAMLNEHVGDSQA